MEIKSREDRATVGLEKIGLWDLDEACPRWNCTPQVKQVHHSVKLILS